MKKILPIFASLFGLFLVVFGIYFYLTTQTVSQSSSEISFTISKGESIKNISSKLESKKIIKNKYIFIAVLYQIGLKNKIHAGNFSLDPSMSYVQIAKELSQKGTYEYWLKIADGSRVEEISSQIPSNLPFTPKEFELKAKQYFGRIYPDSYKIPNDYTVDQVLSLITANFDKKFLQASQNAIGQTYTADQLIILASLLEREGKSIESKRSIAGILFNRLKIGMPLQLDATVQYAVDSKLPRPKEYWSPVSKNDLSIDSPYNTYKVNGLTPGPICNPGYNSLYAVYHPIPSDYLFYITGNDGLMHYAKTLEEHNKNITRYLR